MSWALPLEPDDRGAFPARGPGSLAGRARLVLGIAPGERPLLPEFGWKGHRLDLEDPVTRQAAAVLAEDALRRWAPDLCVEKVDVIGVKGKTADLTVSARGEEVRIGIPLSRGPR